MPIFCTRGNATLETGAPCPAKFHDKIFTNSLYGGPFSRFCISLSVQSEKVNVSLDSLDKIFIHCSSEPKKFRKK